MNDPGILGANDLKVLVTGMDTIAISDSARSRGIRCKWFYLQNRSQIQKSTFYVKMLFIKSARIEKGSYNVYCLLASYKDQVKRRI